MSDHALPTSTVVAATHAEQASPTISPFILAFDIIVAVFTWLFSFDWSAFFLRIFAIVSFPFRLILIPLSLVTNVLLTVFAPVIYLFSYTIAGVRSVWAFLAGLEPLYTFFGAAAGVGIMAGVTIALFSSIITSYLGMQNNDPGPKRSASKESLLETGSRRDSLSSDTDLGWQWLDSSSSRRRPTSGLLSQTIHEEDDDSEY
ncbi:hypothetical protein SNK03_008797 [Fusarium graminearum]|uniref:Chromosome 4, complete genome n=1 Tax=Gibberella zeae (strain ATCC MYA-4620 / CBS 123657 / FGSC 9075 / NRRL 31084 / PH-1) TaxID=229533 RepID=I1RTA7_GIBZE|nr:hypothetical protein FGSG_07408 [Fusarium graminearum PH-1]EYB27449.1 hypothetical protein FG05_07408 [Fusarium graminearum]ESU13670.1 hypothetical protein FGSG_07408 [Fusarium graminearum PH-1]KAI6755257.1 hypothetical protein HG531_004363 [Fusarium graminearum]PCD40818.1 hypothetical protein FGRA07_02089 [Fusarium graminearum]CAF3458369.1 unnamed protein product [Fusarium graminearum]|eukprot:XP_011327177.1 hypothetical protein FGSG_07408 [Fusarium graminearum PH-1]